jgi:hypothetical protein
MPVKGQAQIANTYWLLASYSSPKVEKIKILILCGHLSGVGYDTGLDRVVLAKPACTRIPDFSLAGSQVLCQ